MLGAIVGCGMIAGGYDEGPVSDYVRTHAGAMTRRGIRIGACVEPDGKRRARFMTRWAVSRGYETLEGMLADGEPFDLVSVCTPTEQHAADLSALLPAPVRAVFAEKPVAGDLRASRTIVDAYRRAGRPLAVNYSRRWSADFNVLGRDIADGKFGAVTGATAWYGKGIVHNGSHMLDLFRMLLGELQPVNADRLIDDGRDDDPTVDALLRTSAGAPVRLIGTDYRQYDVFELQLRFTDAIVTLEEGGARLRIRPIEDNEHFSGHRRPGHGGWRDITPRDGMLRAIDNIRAHLERGEPLASDGDSALQAHELAAALVAMARA
jgi:predicted dehydrogenase